LKKKIDNDDIAKLKKEDQETRLFRIRIQTQMDNTIYAFMYTVESHELEVEKDAEKHLITSLFEPTTLEYNMNAIQAGKYKLNTPIESARKIAKKAVQEAKTQKTQKVSLVHIKTAIKKTDSPIWPFRK
jgi:hypothetical protein